MRMQLLQRSFVPVRSFLVSKGRGLGRKRFLLQLFSPCTTECSLRSRSLIVKAPHKHAFTCSIHFFSTCSIPSDCSMFSECGSRRWFPRRGNLRHRHLQHPGSHRSAQGCRQEGEQTTRLCLTILCRTGRVLSRISRPSSPRCTVSEGTARQHAELVLKAYHERRRTMSVLLPLFLVSRLSRTFSGFAKVVRRTRVTSNQIRLQNVEVLGPPSLKGVRASFASNRAGSREVGG